MIITKKTLVRLLADAQNDGYDNGALDGWLDGVSEGYWKGRSAGFREGWSAGYAAAINEAEEEEVIGRCFGCKGEL